MRLAQQSGVDIASMEPGLDRIPVRGVYGRLSTRKALDRLLSGLPFMARQLDSASFRIVRRALPPSVSWPAKARLPQPQIDSTSDIIVTASKRDSTLLRLPSTVTFIDAGTISDHGATQARSLSDIAGAMPILQNTELGPGRNKIFIRGIADSSFNGPTQSVSSVYFGDIQVGYSGADPDLRLYDVARVEILEGPQGTLYGAGAIGGIIRVTPNPVDLSRNTGMAAGGVTLSDARLGYDGNAMLNLVLKPDEVGLRAVAYALRSPGYIDDRARGLADVNSVRTVGGRIALALEPGDGWSVELGALFQKINAADAQYADGSGDLIRKSAIAQPFRNDIVLGRVVVNRQWDSGLRLTSSTGLVDYGSRDIFDATRNAASVGPTIYKNATNNQFFSHETRIFRTLPNGSSWLIGAAFLRDLDRQQRALGPVSDPVDIIGVTNRTLSLSGFTEGTLALNRALSITAGGRLSWTRMDGEPSAVPRGAALVRGKATLRLDPTIAASWAVAPHMALYARYQSGFRTGGIAVARGVGRVTDFESDSIRVVEAGLRLQPDNPRAPSLSTGMSLARWRAIQADLVDRRGLPYTANIGNAHIVALEGNAHWSPLNGLDGALAALYTFNKATGPLADSSLRENRRLPDTPALSASASLSYRWRGGDSDQFLITGNAQYVGRSVLGTGDYFDISQGRYAVAGLSGSWTHKQYMASLSVDNITNRKDNRFSLGNPFMLATRSQATPLAPLRARVGLSVVW